MKTERESFHRDHDKNGDGKMDASEIMSWIIPDDYDHTVAETQHLLQEADSDKVCSLNFRTHSRVRESGLLVWGSDPKLNPRLFNFKP